MSPSCLVKTAICAMSSTESQPHLQSELHIETSKVSIEGDRVLMERYGTRVPVVLLDEVEHFAGKVTEGELRRAIKKARWRRPISRILSRLGYAPKRG